MARRQESSLAKARKQSGNFCQGQPARRRQFGRPQSAKSLDINSACGAVAEKLSALRTEKYFAERAARGDIPKALTILKHAGVGNPPMKGDKLSRPRKRA